MPTPPLPRRGFLSGTLGLALLGTAACGTSTGSTSTTPSAAASGSTTAAATSSTDAVPTLESLTAEVTDKFQQLTFDDNETGKSLPYNLFVPEGYDAAKSCPLVLYIADSSLAGQEVAAPLSQYGALIWASAAEQAKHEAIIVVPEYPSVIIDDHGSYTTTDYVEMTTRLLDAVFSEHRVDPDRVYGTGQSMGCMTVMYLAAQHPDLFAAELFVSGQWDISQLDNLAQEKFFYIAAGGDPNASAGQTDVQGILDDAGVPYQTATWDATWSPEQFSTAAAKLFAAGNSINFATFKTGTVLEVAGTSSSSSSSASGTAAPPSSAMSGPPSGAPSRAPSGTSEGSSGGGGDSSEHMASFEPAYKITALRDWLFQQTA